MATLEEVIAAMEATADGKGRITPLQVEGWPLLHVREPLAEEMDIADDENDGQPVKDKRTLARGAARFVCHEDGKRMFDPKNEAHVALLGRQPWAMLEKIIAIGQGKGGN